MLSEKALQLLQQMFAENSNLQLPIGVFKEVLEIKEWIAEQIKNKNTK